MRSNTCPTSPQRSPVATQIPKLPAPTNKFTEFDFSEQRRGLFGKKENLLAYTKVEIITFPLIGIISYIVFTLTFLPIVWQVPIKKPVINTRDKKLKKEAIEMFKCILLTPI